MYKKKLIPSMVKDNILLYRYRTDASSSSVSAKRPITIDWVAAAAG